jgi:hypothetical protein
MKPLLWCQCLPAGAYRIEVLVLHSDSTLLGAGYHCTVANHCGASSVKLECRFLAGALLIQGQHRFSRPCQTFINFTHAHPPATRSSWPFADTTVTAGLCTCCCCCCCMSCSRPEGITPAAAAAAAACTSALPDSAAVTGLCHHSLLLPSFDNLSTSSLTSSDTSAPRSTLKCLQCRTCNSNRQSYGSWVVVKAG